MTLNDKIKQILSDKNISPSFFADEIGIQRSSVSHILAGRNKPSLDIVQKIIKRFPELGMNWILDDEDLPEVIPETKPARHGVEKPDQNPTISEAPESRRKNIVQDVPVYANLVKEKTPHMKKKEWNALSYFIQMGPFRS